MLTEESLEKYLKKLIGRTDMEDGLKRLDKLTIEESRMATAENLKATHAVDERVKGVTDTVATIDKRVTGVDDHVAGVNERVAGVGDQVQRTANDVDEVKRSSSLDLISANYRTLRIFQKTNYGRTSKNGFPHRIPRRTTTSHAALIIRKLQPGFFKEAYFKSGSQQDRSFGSTENVCPTFFLTRLYLIASFIVAGSGKSVIWFVVFNGFLSEVTDFSCQFHGHRRYSSHVRDWKYVDGVFLF